MKYCRIAKHGVYLYKKNTHMIPKYALPVIILASHHYNNYSLEIVGNTALTMIDYSVFLIEGYLNALDKWRDEEAQYEEKNDPPGWNINLYDNKLHIATIIAMIFYLSHQMVGQIPIEIYILYLSKFKKEKIIENIYNNSISLIDSTLNG